MGIMPVEFERACERRWIEKFPQPAPAVRRHDLDQNDTGEASPPAAQTDE